MKNKNKENSDEQTFSPEEIESAKKTLVKMKKDIFKEIDAGIKEGSSKDSTEYRGDNYDIASSERDRELMYMLGDRERKKVREIDNALLKIKEGTYGVCDECGEPISKKRLKIIPYSNLCINCQSRAEEEEKKRMSEDYIDHLSTLSLISDDETFKDSDE
ncbi:MAG: TraR/DksA family transcriptional regulator [Deltaproteobacteria bacterium]|jgi:DnaK suppressor protein|nr:TraR/DksA family transcriptional regulator [Deltaproteobacteria bacterium]